MCLNIVFFNQILEAQEGDTLIDRYGNSWKILEIIKRNPEDESINPGIIMDIGKTNNGKPEILKVKVTIDGFRLFKNGRTKQPLGQFNHPHARFQTTTT